MGNRELREERVRSLRGATEDHQRNRQTSIYIDASVTDPSSQFWLLLRVGVAHSLTTIVDKRG